MSGHPPLRSERTLIRLGDVADADALLRYRIDNRDHLAPWEPLREASYYTREHCRRTLAEGQAAARHDRAYPLLVLAPDEGRMLASITFSNVVRGAFQACLLGYGIALDQQGRGLMHEALQASLAWAFGTLELHRVMANYMPRNQRSGRLLERLGFEREGLARDYLRIAGCWEDHVLTARIGPAVR